MTEEEKIFAGKLFDARTRELRDIKHKAHILCQRFNQMDEYDAARLPVVREFIGAIGEKYYFQGPIQFNYGSHTFIGELQRNVPACAIRMGMFPFPNIQKISILETMFGSQRTLWCWAV